MTKRIKMVVFDIDGVLTDGMLYIDSNSRETKKVSLTEIDALNEIGKQCLIGAITGEDTPIVDYFRRIANWLFFESGCKDKKQVLIQQINNNGLTPSEVCYIGDGKYDISAVEYAGIGICPKNAIQEVKDVADIVLNGRGGETCIYELYRLLKNGKIYEGMD